jgi:hypothetical protein
MQPEDFLRGWIERECHLLEGRYESLSPAFVIVSFLKKTPVSAKAIILLLAGFVYFSLKSMSA